MKPSLVLQSILSMMGLAPKLRRPLFIWGAPGIGKSQIVYQATKMLNIKILDLRIANFDPTDLKGFPRFNGDGHPHWASFDFWPRDGAGLLFLDEINAAPPATQATTYQLIHDRKIGDYEMPEEWLPIAAGNRETDRAVTHRLSSALASRFIHVNMDVDNDDWTAWALQSGIDHNVIAFLRFRPALLVKFEPSSNQKAFPCPRTWEFLSNLMQSKPNQEIEFELYSGTVGEGAAVELMGFLKVARNLPDMDEILLNPMGAPVPDESETSALYAVSSALARKATDANFERVIKYSERMPTEFSVLTVSDAIRRDRKLTACKTYVNWAVAHKDIIL